MDSCGVIVICSVGDDGADDDDDYVDDDDDDDDDDGDDDGDDYNSDDDWDYHEHKLRAHYNYILSFINLEIHYILINS